MFGGFTFYGFERFKEFIYNNIVLIYDTETNYIKVNDVVLPPKEIDLEYIQNPLNFTNKIIQNWINNNNYFINRVAKNNKSSDLISDINTNDSEIWESLKHNKFLYYYLEDVESYNEDRDIFKGYYFNVQLLQKLLFDIRF